MKLALGCLAGVGCCAAAAIKLSQSKKARKRKPDIGFPARPPTYEDFAAFVDETIGPDYNPRATATSTKRGIVHKLVMKSGRSKFYPGRGLTKDGQTLLEQTADLGPFAPCRGLLGEITNVQFVNCTANVPEIMQNDPYKRSLHVYVPFGLDPATPAPFLLVNDGVAAELMGSIGGIARCCCGCGGCLGHLAEAKSVIGIVDSLIESGRIPPIVCISMDSGGHNGNGDANGVNASQRGLEYDTVSGKFAEFVEAEVLPFVAKACNVTLTSNPNGRAVYGFSSGGLAALSMAWFRPDLFSRVLGYSMSTTNMQYPFNPDIPKGGWDFHSGRELIKNGPPNPTLRVCMYSMEYDWGYQIQPDQPFNWTCAGHRTAKALKEKGCTCRHVFCKGASHCDLRVMMQTLPEALEWLWNDSNI